MDLLFCYILTFIVFQYRSGFDNKLISNLSNSQLVFWLSKTLNKN